MENLKRIGESQQAAAAKRFRPDESHQNAPPVGGQLMAQSPYSMPPAHSSGPNTVVTRLVLNKLDFGKLVGKGGQMISSIRTATGAVIKGVDVSDELRLVTINGLFNQVMDAFGMISDILCLPGNYFVIDIAVEHTNAGRVVGSKGAMLSILSSKSGISVLTISKEPQEMQPSLQPGLMLRVVHLEGSLQAVRRAHFHILELFYTPPGAPTQHAQTSSAYGGGGGGGGGAFEFGIPAPLSSFAQTPAQLSSAGVPFNALTSKGVPQNVVQQFRDLDAYIKQYGLSVQICENAPANSGYSGSSGNQFFATGGPSRYPVSTGRDSATADTRKHSFFEIPSEEAGGIIGKGGSNLRELGQEFGCRVRMEAMAKSDPAAMRKVLIWHDDESVHASVKARIQHMLANPAADPSTAR
jgi:predicted RNA-binding protein YlqC (UPF0109 family)